MNQNEKWMWEIDAEILNAVSARENGNEGKARVCSRRAVGIIIGVYLNRLGYSMQRNNSIELISFLLSLPDVDEQSRLTASHFLLKVDADYSLPANIDLIREAEWLKNKLLLERSI